MKNLKDVLEKLSIDNIVPDKEFPINGTVEDIVKFLIENGYKEIPYEKFWETTIDKFLDFANTIGKCFMANDFGSDTVCLSFMDKSNHEFKNILFNIIEDSNKYQYNILNIETAVDEEDAKIINKSQFLKRVNKLF